MLSRSGAHIRWLVRFWLPPRQSRSKRLTRERRRQWRPDIGGDGAYQPYVCSRTSLSSSAGQLPARSGTAHGEGANDESDWIEDQLEGSHRPSLRTDATKTSIAIQVLFGRPIR